MRSFTEEEAKELVELVRLKVWIWTRGSQVKDRDDVVQEVVTRVLEQLPRYDSTRSSLRTFQNRLIDKAYVDHVRHERAAKRGLGRVRCGGAFADIIDGQAYRGGGHCARPQTEQSDLAMDLDKAIRALEPDQQCLCSKIKQKPVSDVAQEEGVARGTIYRRLRSVRAVFDSLQLAEYLD